jgi:hypothetical protein
LVAGHYNPLDRLDLINGIKPKITNTGIIPKTISAFDLVSRHDLAGPVESAGVVELYPSNVVQSKAPANAL